ncbi:hypothetical protein A4S05_18315 [Nostoc sp. KVJ20]|nr:hypothetical protein A4S05_18315 [Nostoc sp. KVJ20]
MISQCFGAIFVETGASKLGYQAEKFCISNGLGHKKTPKITMKLLPVAYSLLPTPAIRLFQQALF